MTSNALTVVRTSASLAPRIRSIDAMRGLVMLIMLIDHARERFFLHMNVSDPMDIQHTDPLLYWTRLAAHLCAPTFVFLTGLSAWLYAHKADAAGDIQTRSPAGFLAKRGLVLIFIEVVVLLGLWFGLANTVYLQVIWAIGLSMLALALLCRLPTSVLLTLGLMIVFGHNLLTPVQFQPGEWGYSLWTILHDRGYLLKTETFSIKVSYPLLPWIGVILLGYCAGPLYARATEPSDRQNWLLKLGLGCWALFALLRGLNIYGETLDWQNHSNTLLTLMDLFNVTKYPPSLAFLLLTLGLMFVLLWAMERLRRFADSKVEEALVSFGSAPMFFYILHLYWLMVLYFIGLMFIEPSYPVGKLGLFLGVEHVSAVWLIALLSALVLYWPTRWFGQFKQRSAREKGMGWMRYL
ncbi:MAG: DUF1624 domain-containing protein [Oceanobacter sp.]